MGRRSGANSGRGSDLSGLEDGKGRGGHCDQCVPEAGTNFQGLVLEVKSPKEDKVGGGEMPHSQSVHVICDWKKDVELELGLLKDQFILNGYPVLEGIES